MDGKGTEDSENVIRLPRDWVGPPEELIPIGSRARARAREDDLPQELPANPNDFWGEGASALHSAIEDLTPGGHADSERPASRRPAGRRVGHRRLRDRWGLPHVSGRMPYVGGRRPARWPVVAATVVVIAVVVVAVLGNSEGSPSRTAHAPAAAVAQRATTSAAQRDTAIEPSRSTLESMSTRAVGTRHAARRHRPAAQTPHRASTRRTAQHRAATPETVTHAATETTSSSPPPAAVSQSAQTTSSPVATSASSASSGGGGGGSTEAPAGPTGVGSAGSNCNPKCSN